MERFKKFIEKHVWIIAKSYKNLPHEYVAIKYLEGNDREEFYHSVHAIRTHGFTAFFGSTPNRYFISGEYYYFTMGAPIMETTIINRAKLENYDFVPRKDGNYQVCKRSQA